MRGVQGRDAERKGKKIKYNALKVINFPRISLGGMKWPGM